MKPREKPQIFTTEQVKAFAEGRLNTLLFPIQPQPKPNPTGRWAYIADSTERGRAGKFEWCVVDPEGSCFTDRGREICTTYAPPFDVHNGEGGWVRERWAQCGDMGGVWFAAGVPVREHGFWDGKIVDWAAYDKLMGLPVPENVSWKNANHMPRWASRYQFDVTNIAVMQLLHLPEVETIGIGLNKRSKDNGITWKYGMGEPHEPWAWHDWDVSPLVAAMRFWDQKFATMPGQISDLNPWAWVVTIKPKERK